MFHSLRTFLGYTTPRSAKKSRSSLKKAIRGTFESLEERQVLAYEFIGSFQVPVTNGNWNTPVYQGNSIFLENDVDYQVVASGTALMSKSPNRLTDAEFYQPKQPNGSVDPNVWEDKSLVPGATHNLGVRLKGANSSELFFSRWSDNTTYVNYNHIYSRDIKGTGANLQVSYVDSNYTDNGNGSLKVDVYGKIAGDLDIVDPDVEDAVEAVSGGVLTVGQVGQLKIESLHKFGATGVFEIVYDSSKVTLYNSSQAIPANIIASGSVVTTGQILHSIATHAGTAELILNYVASGSNPEEVDRVKLSINDIYGDLQLTAVNELHEEHLYSSFEEDDPGVMLPVNVLSKLDINLDSYYPSNLSFEYGIKVYKDENRAQEISSGDTITAGTYYIEASETIRNKHIWLNTQKPDEPFFTVLDEILISAVVPDSHLVHVSVSSSTLYPAELESDFSFLANINTNDSNLNNSSDLNDQYINTDSDFVTIKLWDGALPNIKPRDGFRINYDNSKGLIYKSSIFDRQDVSASLVSGDFIRLEDIDAQVPYLYYEAAAAGQNTITIEWYQDLDNSGLTEHDWIIGKDELTIHNVTLDITKSPQYIYANATHSVQIYTTIDSLSEFYIDELRTQYKSPSNLLNLYDTSTRFGESDADNQNNGDVNSYTVYIPISTFSQIQTPTSQVNINDTWFDLSVDIRSSTDSEYKFTITSSYKDEQARQKQFYDANVNVVEIGNFSNSTNGSFFDLLYTEGKDTFDRWLIDTPAPNNFLEDVSPFAISGNENVVGRDLFESISKTINFSPNHPLTPNTGNTITIGTSLADNDSGSSLRPMTRASGKLLNYTISSSFSLSYGGKQLTSILGANEQYMDLSYETANIQIDAMPSTGVTITNVAAFQNGENLGGIDIEYLKAAASVQGVLLDAIVPEEATGGISKYTDFLSGLIDSAVDEARTRFAQNTENWSAGSRVQYYANRYNADNNTMHEVDSYQLGVQNTGNSPTPIITSSLSMSESVEAMKVGDRYDSFVVLASATKGLTYNDDYASSASSDVTLNVSTAVPSYFTSNGKDYMRNFHVQARKLT